MVLTDVDAVDEQLSGGRQEESADKPPHCRFAGADAADDADPFTGLDGDVEPAQNLVFGARIGEADILEQHRAAADRPVDEADRVGPVFRLRHDRVDNPQRQHGLPEARERDGDQAERRDCPARQHDGADDRARRDLAFREGVGAGNHQGDGHELLDGARNVAGGGRKLLDLFRRVGRIL